MHATFMKKTLLFGGLCLASISSFGQTAITIMGTDVPKPTGPINTVEISPTAAVSLGDNQTWNYSSLIGFNPATINYSIESDAVFTVAGIDVKLDVSKSFNAGFSYLTSREIDYSSVGVEDKGLYVYPAAYELSTFTGSKLDSLKLPEQKYVLSSPVSIMKFPMTKGSAWKSTSNRSVNFTLSVASAGLVNTPSQHRYKMVRKDTIVAWGKLSVHTGTGASIPYDVLVDQFEQYAIDSFYVGGAPASPALQAAFSVSQGQITDKQYAYHFYRKGSPTYLMRLTYGADNTYTKLAAAFVNVDGLTKLGIDQTSDIRYTSLVFPNPSLGNVINVQISGKTIVQAGFDITDVWGKSVAKGLATTQGNNLFQVSLNNSIAEGNYILNLYDQDNKRIVQEHILIQQ